MVRGTEILMDHQQKQILLAEHRIDRHCNRRTKSGLKDVLLVSSLLLNLLLSIMFWPFPINRSSHQVNHRDAGIEQGVRDNNSQVLTWSRHAAEETEATAAYDCSGHGYVFVDTVNIGADDGGKTFNCECNDCYTGPDCSQMVADCAANVDSGDPLFLEPFWIRNAEASATVFPGWYRMSYKIQDSGTIQILSPELETQIRGIHALVGNAVTEGRYIVIGTGSKQLINAAVYSLSPRRQDAQLPAHVVAVPPHYGTYRTQTEMFDSADYSWEGDARAWVKRSKSLNSTRFVEIVASPNNPSGSLQEGVLEGRNVRTVYDHAYYWPHFTAINEPVNEDVMLFTLSKLTGHAGSRLGWAIVKDFNVYQKMTEYIFGNTLGVSHDSQLRATTLLKTVIAGYQGKLKEGKGDESRNQTLLFHYAYDVMRGRWQRLEKIFSGSQRFSLEYLTSNYCSFFRTVTGPSPAYAWVKCEREEDEDCTAVMKSGGIVGRRGEEFEGDKRYVRLSLIRRDDNFALLERRLQALVSYRNFTVSSTTT
eukprot:PITA_28721